MKEFVSQSAGDEGLTCLPIAETHPSKSLTWRRGEAVRCCCCCHGAQGGCTLFTLKLSPDSLPTATTLPPIGKVGRRGDNADGGTEPTGFRRSEGAAASVVLAEGLVYEVVSIEAGLFALSLAALCEVD